MSQFFIDFNNYNDINELLQDWTPRWDSSSSHWSLTTLNDRKVISQVTLGTSLRTLLSYNDVDGSGDIEILAKFMSTDVSLSSTPQLRVKASGTGTSETGIGWYYVNILNKHTIFCYRDATSSENKNNIALIDFIANTWYCVRFRIVGGITTYIKIWESSQLEPSDWQDSFTFNSAFTGDWNGIGAFNSNVGIRYWEYVGFGTNGDTAPTEISTGDISISSPILTSNANIIIPQIATQKNISILTNILSSTSNMLYPTFNNLTIQNKTINATPLQSNAILPAPSFYNTTQGYVLERRVNSGGWHPIAIVTDLVEQYDDTNVVLNNFYEYRLKKFITLQETEYSNISGLVYGSIPPIITLINVSTTKISDKITKDICTATFTVDQDILEWEARADGIGQGSGLLVGNGGNVLAETEIIFEIENEELTLGDKQYQINIYVKNLEGEWF